MEGFYGNNPLTGVANVFDLGLVFMVGLLKAVFYAYRLANGSLICPGRYQGSHII